MNTDSNWYLHGYLEGEDLPRRIPISNVPFRIGRSGSAEARLPIHHVSELHAEIYQDGDALWLRDLDSSNGTFRNRERLTGDVELHDGDIIHFSTNEFVLRSEEKKSPQLVRTMLLSSKDLELPEHFRGGVEEMQDLLDRELILPHYQPLVRLSDAQQIIGFEVMGRGGHDDLPASSEPLFQLAESAGLEISLSQLIRRKGLFLAQVLTGTPKMFIKCHSSEVGSKELLSTLAELRTAIPDTEIVLETHETAVRSTTTMNELRSALAELTIGLAYDDFGADHGRLTELVEVPPDFIKFDASLIRDIDKAPVARQKMLETLVSIVNGLGIASLAKGIESADEMRICRELGFAYGQGSFVGLPAPIHSWLRPTDEIRDAPCYKAG